MSDVVASPVINAKFEIGDHVENSIRLDGWWHRFQGVVVETELRDGVFHYRCRDEVVWAAESFVKKLN